MNSKTAPGRKISLYQSSHFLKMAVHRIVFLTVLPGYLKSFFDSEKLTLVTIFG